MHRRHCNLLYWCGRSSPLNRTKGRLWVTVIKANGRIWRFPVGSRKKQCTILWRHRITFSHPHVDLFDADGQRSDYCDLLIAKSVSSRILRNQRYDRGLLRIFVYGSNWDVINSAIQGSFHRSTCELTYHSPYSCFYLTFALVFVSHDEINLTWEQRNIQNFRK